MKLFYVDSVLFHYCFIFTYMQKWAVQDKMFNAKQRKKTYSPVQISPVQLFPVSTPTVLTIKGKTPIAIKKETSG